MFESAIVKGLARSKNMAAFNIKTPAQTIVIKLFIAKKLCPSSKFLDNPFSPPVR